MPIYAYRCEECNFSKDVMQKMSDEPLTVCPSCGKASFKKQLTAAAVHGSGSGSSMPMGGCGACPMSGGFGGPCG